MLFHIRNQATVAKEIIFSGIGVHSGLPVTMKILPAPENFGIAFKRTDVRNSIVKVEISNVTSPVMCTRTVNKEGVSVSVIEHLMAALRILGVTNALIEIDSEEVPIMDGSSIEFVKAFEKTGVTKQKSKVKTMVIKQPISLQFDTGYISATPCTDCSIRVSLNYDRVNRVIGSKNHTGFKMSERRKLMVVAESRTFGWLEDYDRVRKAGMARGSSADNTIIIGPNDAVINREGLRNRKEVVNHKALDLLGDLSVSEYDIIGQITAVNPSHLHNHNFLKKIMMGIEDHTILFEKSETSSREEALHAVLCSTNV
jgi:UDP-3-O-[3-hydroxymyristoyl] N-acetylglucosamine deacetylase